MMIKDRLEAYRRKKQKEKMMKSIKSVVRNIFSWNRNDGIKKSVEESTKEEEVKLCEQSQNDIEDVENASSEDNVQESKSLDQSNEMNPVPILFLILIAKL
nr:PREDICTED: uncharacterized protein LOC105680103 isoform X2 [Linepithema humile]